MRTQIPVWLSPPQVARSRKKIPTAIRLSVLDEPLGFMMALQKIKNSSMRLILREN
jgi:hypothetical protein